MASPFPTIYLEDMKIVGNKVLLRSIEEQDQGMLQCLIDDPEIVKITKGYGNPASCGQQINKFRSLQDTDHSLHAVIADHDDSKTGLGIIMLSHVDSQAKTAEIHIKLLPSARGRGYGRDAVDTLVSFAFRELGLHYICASILEHNTASRRLFEACGFQQEKTRRGRADKNGNCRNVCFYGIKSDSGRTFLFFPFVSQE